MLLVSSLKSLVRIYRKRPDAGPGATHASGVRYASAFALMLASAVAALLAVFAGALVGVIEPGLTCSRAAGADRRSGRALAG